MADPQREIPLAANVSEGDIAGQEILINVLTRRSTGGKYPFTLIHSPGQAAYAKLPTAPIKQMHDVGGRHFAVTSTKFYEVFTDGTFTELGDINLVGRAVMANNGLQIVVVDGFRGFFYDIATNTVSQILSAAFYPAATVTEQDGFFIFDRKGTDEFFISKLNSVEFDGADFSQAGGRTDKLAAVISDHRELFLFGAKSTRVHYNSGDADFPFELNQGAYIEKGCPAPHTVVRQNNTIFFVGSDLMVYSLRGYSPLRISTHAVEKTLANVDLSDAYAYEHQEEGQLFYTLTIPKSNITWRYDVSTNNWHICQDFNFGRHRSNCSVFSNGKTLVGDFQSGQIFHMTNTHLLDDGGPIEREIILPTVNMGRGFVSVWSLEFDMKTGIGLYTGQGKNPRGMVTFSKNGGKRWSNIKYLDLGKLGEDYTRAKVNRFGASRQFIFRLRITDPVPIEIGGAFIEV